MADETTWSEARGIAPGALATKAYPTEFKLDRGKRILKGYTSLFDVVDSYGDRVKSGAFKKSIDNKFRGRSTSRIKTLWQHAPGNPIGIPTHMEEDSTGLYIEAKLSKTRAIDEYMTLIEDGVVDGLSIGYRTIKAAPFVDEELSASLEGWLAKAQLYDLIELDLSEFSVVTFPALTDARVAVKSKGGVWCFRQEAPMPGVPVPDAPTPPKEEQQPSIDWEALTNILRG